MEVSDPFLSMEILSSIKTREISRDPSWEISLIFVSFKIGLAFGLSSPKDLETRSPPG